MVLLIIVIGGILVEELELGVLGARTAQELRSIVAILVGIHHVIILGQQGDTGRDTGGDTGSHRLVAAGLDENHTIGTLGTIKSGTVTHHGHLLDICGIDVAEDVIEESVVQHLASILLVDGHTINHYQWLGIHIQRVETLDEGNATHTGRTVSVGGIGVGTQLLLHLLLDIDGVRIGEASGLLVTAQVVGLGIITLEGGAIEHDVLLLFRGSETSQHGVVVGRRDIERGGKYGHLEFEGTVVLGQHTIASDTAGLDDGTCYGHLGGSIHHTSFHHACGINLFLGGQHAGGLFLLIGLVILCERTERESHHQRDSQNHISFHSLQIYKVTVFLHLFHMTYFANLGSRMMQSIRKEV